MTLSFLSLFLERPWSQIGVRKEAQSPWVTFMTVGFFGFSYFQATAKEGEERRREGKRGRSFKIYGLRGRETWTNDPPLSFKPGTDKERFGIRPLGFAHFLLDDFHLEEVLGNFGRILVFLVVKEERIGYSSLFFVRARLLAEEEATKYFLGGRVVLTDEGYLWAVEREMACAHHRSTDCYTHRRFPTRKFLVIKFQVMQLRARLLHENPNKCLAFFSLPPPKNTFFGPEGRCPQGRRELPIFGHLSSLTPVFLPLLALRAHGQFPEIQKEKEKRITTPPPLSVQNPFGGPG